MSTQLQLAIPSFDEWQPEQLTEYAAGALDIMRSEAQTAAEITQQAAERAWLIGKACVLLKTKMNADEWEEYAKTHIGGGDYTPVWRSMRFYRMSPTKPPGRAAAQFKQLQIMFGGEPIPKDTPRKPGAQKLVNFKACTSGIQRWWRSGDAIEGLDAETLKEIAEDLAPIVAIAQAVNVALTNAQS